MSKAFLPDPAFRAATVAPPGRLVPLEACDWDDAAGLVDRTLASTPLHGGAWSALFAYMHRRFGPPHLGGDPYKDLSAGWLLTTPDPEIFMKVSPHVLGAMYGFRLYRRTDDPNLRFADQFTPEPTPESLAAPYRAALLDLLRPVGVRDCHINALGNVGDDDPLLDFDEATQEYLHAVEPHASSGYPMPLGLFGDEDWARLCGMVAALGGGDPKAGKAEALAALREVAVGRARRATRSARVLAAALIGTAEAAGDLAVEADEVASMRASLTYQEAVASLPDLSETELAEAFRLVATFGGSAVAAKRTHARAAAAKADLPAGRGPAR